MVDGDEEESRENIRMQEKSQEILLDWFRQLLRDEEGLQIIYRPHPAEAKNPEFLKRAREIRDFHVIQQESIRNWIMNCDILCNWQSTAMIELYAAKKKSLILRPIPIPFKRAMPIFDEGHFRAVTCYEELLREVREEHPVFPVEEERLLQFYSIGEQPAYERVGRYLIDTLNDPEYHSRDIGGHVTPKGRIIHRALAWKNVMKARAAHSARKLSGNGEQRPDADENYIQNSYYYQMMRQNRISRRELRRQIDLYKSLITKKD